MYSIDEMVEICVKGDVVKPENAEYLRRNLEEFMSYDMPAIVKKVQRVEAALKIFANPENWNDKGHSMGFAEFPFVAGDPIEIAEQALGESCKQPE